MEVITQPVYSKYGKCNLKLPSGYKLYTHQIETIECFQDDEVDVIFNISMTGDGKTLASYLPVLVGEENASAVIGMYPTNELIKDQCSQVQTYIEEFNAKKSICNVYSERITELMEKSGVKERSQQLENILKTNEVILTNPDIFHLMMNYRYKTHTASPDNLSYLIPTNFDYFVFDEFHVFKVPEIVSVLNILNYITLKHKNNPVEKKRFIFSSATPSKLLTEKLERSGLNYKIIQGKYSTEKTENTRKILNQTTIYFDVIDFDLDIEQWIINNLEKITEFFETQNNAKGAIIVNSVIKAKRIVQYLKDNTDLSIGENTGLTSKIEGSESYAKDILVGTSTIDIGIDFKINLLIFESLDTGTFIQRLGRLGRHEGFEEYVAYALVPKYIYERLEMQLSRYSKNVLTRQELNSIIEEIFPVETKFETYPKIWGTLQLAIKRNPF
ncbi:MAG: type I-D CRISPR-associated helicase Cas3' [Methanosarcinales archaeon]